MNLRVYVLEGGGRTMRKGFSLVELLVVMGVIAILMAIIFPVYSSATKSAKRAQCISNMQKLGAAVIQYHQDNNVYPPDNLVGSLMGNKKHPLPEMLTCPLDNPNADSYSGMYNYYGFQRTIAPQLIKATNYPPSPVFNLVSDTDKSRANARDIYLALQSATAVNTMHYWHGGTLATYPQVQADLTQLDAFFGYPDADFPGLVNSSCPPNTIVTICARHLPAYVVLRASGAYDVVNAQTVTDQTFWMLSKAVK